MGLGEVSFSEASVFIVKWNRSGTPDPDELNLKVLVPAVQVGALIGNI